jgi:adenylate cyclase
LRNVEQVASLYDPERHRAHSATFGQDPGVICKAFGAVALWFLGYPDTARQQSEDAIRMSAGQSPTTEAVAVHFASMVHQLCGDHAATLECAERTIAISAQHGLSFWLAGGRILRSWALAQCGSDADALAQLRQGLVDWRETGSVTYETYFLGLLAEILLNCGRIDEAKRTIDEAIALGDRTEERFYEPELYRLRGETALCAGDEPNESDREAAERDFRRSLKLANQQETKSFALRAAMSLARLHDRFGQPEDAPVLLANAYGKFTEGFATRDLRRVHDGLQPAQPG